MKFLSRGNKQLFFTNKNYLSFFFLLIVFLLFGGIIAKKSNIFSIEFSFVLLLVSYLIFLFFQSSTDKETLPTTLKNWLYLLLIFFLLNVIPDVFHLLKGSSYEGRLMSHFEKHAHLLFIAMFVVIAFRLKLTVLSLWKLLILSSFWVFWVLLHETYYLNGFENVSLFISSHRYGVYSSSNRIDFGIYSNTLFIILIGAIFWIKRLGWFWSLALLLALGVTFSGAILSQSRTAWIGWPEAIIAWGIFYGYFLWINKRKGSLFFVLSTLIVVVWFIGQSTFYSVIEKRSLLAIKDIKMYIDGNPNTSLGNRFVMYESAYLSIKENPLIGVGPNHFKEELDIKTRHVFENRFNKKNRSLSYGQVHNQFLMSFMEGGALAFLSLILLFSYLIYIFGCKTKNKNFYQKSLGIVGVVFTLASLMTFMPESPLYTKTQFIFFFLLTSLLLLMNEVKESNTKLENR